MTCQIRYIALLRGINVGGHNKLPMAELRTFLSAAGFTDVQTYIQSGNVVFSAEQMPDELAELIAGEIERAFGFRPQVMVLTAEALQAALAANPYPQAADDPKTLHLYFLKQPATEADVTGMEALKADSEAFTLTDQALYLYAPYGIGRSKLAEKAERLLGVPATARNLRTVMKLAEMCQT